MLKMIKGCKVPFPDKLFESYEINKNRIFANVDADKIEKILKQFILMHNEPLFFILELPTAFRDEQEIKPGIIEKFHTDIYYIDGCSKEEAIVILDRVGKILINDGLCGFGFGCHESGDEIMVEKYNTMTIFSRCDTTKYEFLFTTQNIPKTGSVITAWDTFSSDYPGVSAKYEADGVSVFDIPELFADWGIYLAERREEN